MSSMEEYCSWARLGDQRQLSKVTLNLQGVVRETETDAVMSGQSGILAKLGLPKPVLDSLASNNTHYEAGKLYFILWDHIDKPTQQATPQSRASPDILFDSTACVDDQGLVWSRTVVLPAPLHEEQFGVCWQLSSTERINFRTFGFKTTALSSVDEELRTHNGIDVDKWAGIVRELEHGYLLLRKTNFSDNDEIEVWFSSKLSDRHTTLTFEAVSPGGSIVYSCDFSTAHQLSRAGFWLNEVGDHQLVLKTSSEGDTLETISLAVEEAEEDEEQALPGRGKGSQYAEMELEALISQYFKQ